MNITVLCGSPKKEYSITNEHVVYLQKNFPDVNIEMIEISNRIRQIETDQNLFNSIMQSVKNADGIIWAVPVYTYLIPAQYKHFIELIFERNSADNFSGKYAALITTSIHLYDHTAIKYLEQVSEDLGMTFTDYFSAHNFQITIADNKQKIFHFFASFLDDIHKKIGSKGLSKNNQPLSRELIDNTNVKLLIINDTLNAPLKKTVEQFQNTLTIRADEINLNEINIRGGCIGCLHCAFDNECIYDDGFDQLYEKMLEYDGYIFTGLVRDHFLSYKWKEFLDRCFFKNHVPSFKNRQFGIITDKKPAEIELLREYFEEYTQIQEAHFCGTASPDPIAIYRLANKIVRDAKNHYTKFSTFYGVGGKKINRDMIFEKMRFIFHADHAYYKKHHYYNFPRMTFRYFRKVVMAIITTRIKPLKEKTQKEANKIMYKTFVERLYNKK